ncbi:MAG: TVP38/TMEM64 family protein [Mangrovicoccus sp.]|nr:TVP38/TMEM64 family protein [Mangrovicoccus sp.]
MTDLTHAARQAGLIRLLPLLAVAVLALGGAVLFGDRLSLEALARHHERLIAFRDAHYLLAVAGFVTAYATLAALSLPGATVATLTGGFLFQTFPGVLYNVAGATVGACLLFLAVRQGLGTRLTARIDAAQGRVHRIKQGIDRNQWEMLFLIRLIPLVPFFVANLIPALVGVPFHRFLVSTMLGILPAALVYTSVGAGLGTVLDQGGVADPGVVLTAPVAVPILGLCALAVLSMVVRARRRGGS